MVEMTVVGDPDDETVIYLHLVAVRAQRNSDETNSKESYGRATSRMASTSARDLSHGRYYGNLIGTHSRKGTSRLRHSPISLNVVTG